MLAVLEIPVVEAATLFSQRIYDDTATWDLVVPGEPYIGVLVDHQRRKIFIACRGSTTLADFLIDAEAGLFKYAGALGMVALGFYDGIVASYEKIWDFIKDLVKAGYKVIIGGHSLGAAHAALWIGYAGLQGLNAAAYVLMGCPAPGGPELRTQLLKVPLRYSFRNGLDPVYPLPSWLVHPSGLILLREPPALLPAGKTYGLGTLVDWHQWLLYLLGIGKRDFPAIA